MNWYIEAFFKKEFTGIPKLLKKYLGSYYNNALCNGTTWMLLIWFVFHTIFDDFLKALLKRMKYKEYIITRIQHSLWFLGFYVTVCIYSTTSLVYNDLAILKTKDFFDSLSTTSGQLVLGFIVMLTFYLHIALWERLKSGDGMLALRFFALFILLCVCHFSSLIENVYRLTVFMSLTNIFLELARCTTIVKKNPLKMTFLLVFYSISILLFIFNNFCFIPMIFGYAFWTKFHLSLLSVFIVLIVWISLEIYDSVLFKAFCHWKKHQNIDKTACGKNIYECTLFAPRCDLNYDLFLLHKELTEKEMKSSQKPKARNVVFQTLKCMVAMKKKLNERRRQFENSSSEIVSSESNNDESENVVNGRLEFNIANENSSKEKTE